MTDDENKDERLPPAPDAATLPASELVARLAALRDAKTTPAVLASWAFDQFYAIEMGRLVAMPMVEQILDDLMFLDVEPEPIDPARIAALIAELEERS
jgi:hypothetical protein